MVEYKGSDNISNINDLKIGINQLLDRKFPNIDIHNEKIEQGFEEPCFFIKILSSGQNKELNRRYNKNISFDIHYFSEKEDVNSDCLSMADKLYEVLEYVQVGNSLYRANKMTHEVIDGVLHFFLQFNYKVIKQIEESPKMQALDKEVITKNG
ncbi:hypothetical protein KQI86_19405 [Clostridium sp. MSJ-11]|uniref:Phage protein n=1 Tax=Clostridium mobile TaxID=2841512 RepID=A0ABS6ENX2_9CLOT|nr:hypothetical protein [Clostridium mobile]MBU5486472.1 hypothetical protein [Clostridium mobile]